MRRASWARGGDAEARVVGGDADVAGDGDGHPAAHAVAVDHGEDRLGQRIDGVAAPRADPPVLLLVGHVAAAIFELRDVRPRHEGLVPRSAHDDDADGVVGGKILDVLRHELPRLHAHRVPLLGAVEDDPADGAVLLHQEARSVAHG